MSTFTFNNEMYAFKQDLGPEAIFSERKKSEKKSIICKGKQLSVICHAEAIL